MPAKDERDDLLPPDLVDHEKGGPKAPDKTGRDKRPVGLDLDLPPDPVVNKKARKKTGKGKNSPDLSLDLPPVPSPAPSPAQNPAQNPEPGLDPSLRPPPDPFPDSSSRPSRNLGPLPKKNDDEDLSLPEELDLSAELDRSMGTKPEKAPILPPLETPRRTEKPKEPEDEDDEDDDLDSPDQEDGGGEEPREELSTPVQGTNADGQIFEGRIVQEMDLSTMPLELGHRVHIKPGGLNHRVDALFVGMEQNSYLVVRLAGLRAELAEVFPFLYPDNEIKLFFTDKGILKGFLCHIIAYKASPFRHLYLSYPHRGEFFTLRQEDRFLCHLPASLKLGSERLRGMVQDLSTGGCSVNLAHPDPESLPLGKDKEITLSFSLLSAEHMNLARCRIRNIRLEEDMVGLGLSFVKPDEAVVGRITHFLDFLSRYRDTRENSMR